MRRSSKLYKNSTTQRNLNEQEKVEHIVHALQLDAQSIMPLLDQLKQKQNEMRQSFQKAVDIDFQLYGKASSLTERALEAYYFEITPDRQVVEAVKKQQQKLSVLKQLNQNKKEGTENQRKPEEKQHEKPTEMER